MTGQLILHGLKLFQALLVESLSPDKAAFNSGFQLSTNFVLYKPTVYTCALVGSAVSLQILVTTFFLLRLQ